MNFPGPFFCSSYHEFVQSNGRVIRVVQKKGLKVPSPKRGAETRPKSVFSCRKDLSNPKSDPKNETRAVMSYLLLNEVLHTSLGQWSCLTCTDEKNSTTGLPRRDGFSGGISHKSRFVDRSNIPRKIGRPQFNGADKRVQTSGGPQNIRKGKKNQALGPVTLMAHL